MKKIIIAISILILIGVKLFVPMRTITDEGVFFGMYKGCTLSEKPFKTTECILDMGSEIGLSQKFHFSIERDNVEDRYKPFVGKRVELHYVKIANSAITQGQSNFRVIKVIPILPIEKKTKNTL